ncbi:MAG: hypothetical protein KAQ98_09515 [Bacteriovoracaceae bacterium]|nr:hypothetical protein [Bacteriovoracaceae bacterium]
MKLKLNLLTFFLIVITVSNAVADELVFVQAISNTRKRFIISRGLEHDISIGQTRAFSNDSVSVMCKVLEVGRDNSLWQVVDGQTAVPFKRGDTVLFHTHLMDIMKEVLKEKERRRVEKLVESGRIDSLRDEESGKYIRMTKAVRRPNFIIRGAMARAVYQSVSSTDSSSTSSRQGLHLEGLYTKQFINRRFDWGIGFRWDRETEEVSSQNIIIPTDRKMVITEFVYNFDKFRQTLNNIYMGVGFGAGQTTSTVDIENKKGIVLAMPYAKFGLLSHLGGEYYLIIETVIESLISKEKFLETGKEQSSSILNGKIAAGLRFNIL